MLTMGVLARRALCTLASPLASPVPEVQKGRGRPIGHAPVAVGRARRNTLEQPQHATHPPDPVERPDKVHLRGARVGEADLNPRACQRLDQAFFSVHLLVPSPRPRVPTFAGAWFLASDHRYREEPYQGCTIWHIDQTAYFLP